MNDKVKTTETKEVVKKETSQALALSESDMMSDANTGLENVTSEDLAIPFLRITQAMSPQVNARDGKYIKAIYSTL